MSVSIFRSNVWHGVSHVPIYRQKNLAVTFATCICLSLFELGLAIPQNYHNGSVLIQDMPLSPSTLPPFIEEEKQCPLFLNRSFSLFSPIFSRTCRSIYSRLSSKSNICTKSLQAVEKERDGRSAGILMNTRTCSERKKPLWITSLSSLFGCKGSPLISVALKETALRKE